MCTEAQPASQKPDSQLALIGLGVLALLGGAAYVGSSGVLAPEVEHDIKLITDEVFDTTDDMIVFFLGSQEELVSRRAQWHKVIATLSKEEQLKHCGYFYNLMNSGDPPVPAGANTSDDASAPPIETTPMEFKPLKLVLYKGQRKVVLDVDDKRELPMDAILRFFAPVSEKLSKKHRSLKVQRVSRDTFEEDVVKVAQQDKMILVQIYEDSCFLCFLMRPFINSLQLLLEEYEVPLSIKRFNVERNDFHAACPVARGTPTFVCFTGEGKGRKMDEFKPKELVERISKEFPDLPEAAYEQMDELQGLVNRRFQLFTQTVMWTIELQKLGAKAAAPLVVGAGDGGPALASAPEASDQDFNGVVADLMSKDMRRTDTMHDNLKYLDQEVSDIEQDASLLGVQLAEAILRAEEVEERQEAARWWSMRR